MAGEDEVQQQAVVVQATSVKLPDFWIHSPENWLLRAEAIFRSKSITAETTQYDYIVAALPSEIMVQVVDLVKNKPADQPYTTLKNALIERLIKPAAERTRIVLEEEVLGDRQPSQFLRHLQCMLSDEDFQSTFFRHTFITKMPEAVRPFLASNTQATLTELAKQADDLLTFQKAQIPAPSVALVNTQGDEAQFDTLVARVAAQVERSFNIRGRERPNTFNNNRRPRGNRRFNPRQGNRIYDDGYCYYHHFYGNKANSCYQGCSKNGQFGSQH